ncbi:MAG: ECF transporter S component [Clostridia bacterium]|nr:ECF transporter S component [Clostridia bacterium]
MATRNKSTLKLVQLGILLALVIVLQSIASFGVINICLCLIPITLGAMLLGWKSGLALGATFGVVAAFWGIVGKDIFTLYLFQANPVMTILICLVKGSLAGVAPALLYKWLSGVERLGKAKGLVASIVASISAPIANTGIFALGCVIIMDDVTSVAGQLGLVAANFVTLLFVGLISVNFFVELAINAVFSPALNKLTTVLEKQLK